MCIYVCKFTQISKVAMQISILYRAMLIPFKQQHALEGYIHAAEAITWLK